MLLSAGPKSVISFEYIERALCLNVLLPLALVRHLQLLELRQVIPQSPRLMLGLAPRPHLALNPWHLKCLRRLRNRTHVQLDDLTRAGECYSCSPRGAWIGSPIVLLRVSRIARLFARSVVLRPPACLRMSGLQLQVMLAASSQGIQALYCNPLL